MSETSKKTAKNINEIRGDKILLEAVDDGMGVFGEEIRDVIYFYLNKYNDLRREDIPGNFEAFDAGLKAIFGAGACVIERLIVKNLYAKLQLTFEEIDDWTFIDHIKKVKEKMTV